MPRDKEDRRSKYSASNTMDSREDNMGSSCLKLPANVKFNDFNEKSAGEYMFDIIPFIIKEGVHPNDMDQERLKPGKPSYQWTVWVHNGIGPDRKRVVCLEKQYNEKCPICEARRVITQEPDHDEEAAAALKAKELSLMNVINRAKKSEGIQVDFRSYHLFERKIKEELELQRSKHPEYDDFPSPTDGFTLRLKVQVKKYKAGNYCEVSDVTFVERKSQYDEDIVKKAYPLDTFPKKIEYAKLKSMLGQTPDEDDQDSDGEQVSVGDTVSFERKGKTIMAKVLKVNEAKGTVTLEVDGDEVLTLSIDEVEMVKAGKGGKKKPADDEEEEEEEDEEEEDDDTSDDDDEEEEDDDDTSDDDDDDEEEEEEAPKKKGKPAAKKPAPKKGKK